MNEDQRKHLEFIQNIITRMNSNSFTIKGWAVTLVAALLAVFASTKNMAFLAVSILPIFIFWWLDAKYLQMERQYRSLFNAVANNNQSISVYDLNAKKPFITTDGRNGLVSTLNSETILPFYLLLAMLAAACILTILGLSESKEIKEDKVVKMQVVGEVSTKFVDTLETIEVEKLSPSLTNTQQKGAEKITLPLDTSKTGTNKLAKPVNTPKPGTKE